MQELVRRSALVRRSSTAYFHYRANRWRVSPRFRGADPEAPLVAPIFLLGTQGGGLTFTSRVLRRHPQVVSLSGNHHYWAGAGEMQNILRGHLPDQLSWPRIPGSERAVVESLYACDEYLPYHEGRPEHATPELRREFRRILQGLIQLNRAPDTREPPRFLDMSQSLTIRVGLVQALLAESEPRFVLITRNPLVMCWRLVVQVFAAHDLPEREVFERAVEHWGNSMRLALARKDEARLRWWRIEELLARPLEVVAEICEFCDLPFEPSIMPGAEDRIPWGSASDAFDGSKWFPIRPKINERFLTQVPDWARGIVRERCADLIETFGYDPI